MTVRVLVIGLSPTLGGVETYIYNLIKYMDKEKYKFDFMIIYHFDEIVIFYIHEKNQLLIKSTSSFHPRFSLFFLI